MDANGDVEPFKKVSICHLLCYDTLAVIGQD